MLLRRKNKPGMNSTAGEPFMPAMQTRQKPTKKHTQNNTRPRRWARGLNLFAAISNGHYRYMLPMSSEQFHLDC